MRRLAALPCGQYPPEGQAVQLVEESASLYEPGSQASQLSCPSLSLNCPGAHGRHMSSLRAPTTGMLVPGGQGKPAVRPVALQWCPLGQGEQSLADTRSVELPKVP